MIIDDVKLKQEILNFRGNH